MVHRNNTGRLGCWLHQCVLRNTLAGSKTVVSTSRDDPVHITTAPSPFLFVAESWLKCACFREDRMYLSALSIPILHCLGLEPILEARWVLLGVDPTTPLLVLSQAVPISTTNYSTTTWNCDSAKRCVWPVNTSHLHIFIGIQLEVVRLKQETASFQSVWDCKVLSIYDRPGSRIDNSYYGWPWLGTCRSSWRQEFSVGQKLCLFVSLSRCAIVKNFDNI